LFSSARLTWPITLLLLGLLHEYEITIWNHCCR